MMKRIAWIAAVLLLGSAMLGEVEAQCVMCKAVAEDSAADGGLGRGLNAGILYLMAIPYALLATLGAVFFWRKKARNHS